MECIQVSSKYDDLGKDSGHTYTLEKERKDSNSSSSGQLVV